MPPLLKYLLTKPLLEYAALRAPRHNITAFSFEKGGELNVQEV